MMQPKCLLWNHKRKNWTVVGGGPHVANIKGLLGLVVLVPFWTSEATDDMP